MSNFIIEKSNQQNSQQKKQPEIEEIITISAETAKRIAKEIRSLIKNPLHEEGIYYKHDEDNILKGYAYINGPKDSLYFGGNYFFEFNFPTNYPHSPPKVIFKTSDGITRFHPNLYRNGKICLSILNTWKGEAWTGCQSIRSVLLTIISILDDKPLLHEPGYTIHHKDFESYCRIISYKNIEHTILYYIENKSNFFCLLFSEEIKKNFIKNKEELLKIIKKNKSEKKISTINTYIYNLKIVEKWNEIYKYFNKIAVKIK